MRCSLVLFCHLNEIHQSAQFLNHHGLVFILKVSSGSMTYAIMDSVDSSRMKPY